MSDKHGGPAFPNPDSDWGGGTSGMTLRDWFAGQAVSAYMAWSLDQPQDSTADSKEKAAKKYADVAYAVADAMLEARK